MHHHNRSHALLSAIPDCTRHLEEWRATDVCLWGRGGGTQLLPKIRSMAPNIRPIMALWVHWGGYHWQKSDHWQKVTIGKKHGLDSNGKQMKRCTRDDAGASLATWSCKQQSSPSPGSALPGTRPCASDARQGARGGGRGRGRQRRQLLPDLRLHHRRRPPRHEAGS